ncbi:MAG: trehalose-6-phosphate synthase [Gemmatimonadota bacterium]|jgi:trehalose 6-phosphate synthase
MSPAKLDATHPRRLVVASNRLPVVLTEEGKGDWRLERGSGGLVTALEPVLRERGGVWIGWPGIEKGRIPDLDSVLDDATTGVGYAVRGVSLTATERDDFYLGFSNQVIWPLFHDLLSQCNFDPRFWHTYERVNSKFAAAIADEARTGDFVWIHDYHLMAVARELRDGGFPHTLGFFLHIPFPPLDLFVTLPWRFEILSSLLAFDLLGFQSSRDRKNFLACVERLVPEATLEDGLEERVVRIGTDERTVKAGVFPVSIDFRDFAGTAASDPVSERVAGLRSEFPGRMVFLGVDRLDYSKGIPHKLQGYRLALERYPDLRERVTLTQLVVPSREDIPEYYQLKEEIERLVGRIQGEYTRSGWVPIHYQYGRWDRTELIAHYRHAGAALVTPLKDGMNLVAKEYCACSLEGKGVLILSEYAGATAQLQNEAILVNPHDVEGVADAIHQAFTMPADERTRRMEALRGKIKATDIDWWVETFLEAAADEDLGEDSTVQTYRPVHRERP